jgi:hypothetical protein
MQDPKPPKTEKNPKKVIFSLDFPEIDPISDF